MELYDPQADPDGDGLSTLEEYYGYLGGAPAIDSSPGTANPITTPDFGIGDGQDDYTLPLHFDTDQDNLIDSFEYDFWSEDDSFELGWLNPVDGSDDAYADPDGDGLVTFREQCVHPLLSFYWLSGGPSLYPAVTTYDPFNNDSIGFGSIYWGGFGRAMLKVPGYLNDAQYDRNNSYPNDIGTVEWGHPLVVHRWTEPWYPGGEDSDGDLLPDGWELEHGLNPLNDRTELGLTTGAGLVDWRTGGLAPSGGFGDPDDDGLLNFEEYWGQDSYRIDLVTGSGDEGNPWIARVINMTFVSDFGALIGQFNPSASQHRSRQAPYSYVQPFVSFTALTDLFDPYVYPGFFDPLRFSQGDLFVVPGVPPYVPVSDLDIDQTQAEAEFNPFAVAVGDVYFYESGITSDGRYTPGTNEEAWLDMNLDGRYTPVGPNPDIILTQNLSPIPLNATGLPITVNSPLRWPMPGGDTDDDGLKDNFEITTDVVKGKHPTSILDPLSPFMPRSAFITGTNGIVVPNVDSADGGRRLFNDDWTLECWSYFRDRGNLEYSGGLISGDIAVSTLLRKGYELGVSNTTPYVRYQTIGGTWITVRARTKIQKNKWVHLAGVFDHANNSLKLYVDGILDQSLLAVNAAASAFGKSYAGQVVLGRNSSTNAGNSVFATNVWLDEVRIWGTPRSADEIVNNRSHLINPYQLTPTPQYPQPYLGALFAYFPFDDGGKLAQDFTKRARCSLLSYDFPADPENPAAPIQAYIYGDLGYALDSDAIDGINRSFVFDGNNRPHVIGMVDAEQGGIDSDGDFLPDGWELVHELNPFRTNTPMHSQVYAYDTEWRTGLGTNRDSRLDMEITPDGMNNTYEYYSRTNPRDTDTDEDAVPDTFEDFDGDGLPNGVEVLVNGRPDLADTDDDGINDATEENEGTVLAKSTSPEREQSIFFDGYPGTCLEVPQRSTMRMSSWTIEANVLPLADHQLADGQSVSILRRVVETATNGLYGTTFELRVKRVGSNLTPNAQFVVIDDSTGRGTLVIGEATNLLNTSGAILSTDTNAVDPYPNGNFTHLAVAFDGSVGNMKLYVDGTLVASKDYPSARPPVSGEGPQSFVRIGERFRGYIRDVRIWSKTKSQTAILADRNADLTGTETNLVSYYSMRDGGWPSIKILSPVTGFRSDPATITATNDGARYVVILPASGAFAGHVGEIAEFSALKGSWSFEVPGGSNRVYVSTNGQVYQYTGAPKTWTNVSLLPVTDPVIIRSVRYSSTPITNRGPDDTWWDGANVHTFVNTTDCAVAHSGPLFIEGTNINGAVAHGTFAWYVSRNEYFRYDSAVGQYNRWGPAVGWLADAKAVVKAVVAGPLLLPPLASSNLLVGDVYVVLSPPSYQTWNGTNYLFGSIVDEDRIILEGTGEIFDWRATTTNFGPAVASNRTDGGGLYIYVKNQGYALRSDGIAWKRWGFIPTTEDFTMKNGWTGQWSQAAMRFGGSFFREFGESRITISGTRQPVLRFVDADDDDLPDEWEEANGLDPTDALGDNGPDGDPDGDGLSNMTEYLLTFYELGTYSPQSANSDSDGESDYQEDADGDGLPNGYEEDTSKTRPYFADSDDDFVEDAQELADSTDPMDSLSPFVGRVLAFRQEGGSSGAVVVPYEVSNDNQIDRLSLTNWTVECVANVSDFPAAGVNQPLVSRKIDESGNRNFEIGVRRMVTNGLVRMVPYLAFDDPSGAGTVDLQGGTVFGTNQWVHLAGRFTNGIIKLFMDGSSVGSDRTYLVPATGNGDLVLGGSWPGYLGEIRVWKVGRTDSAIDKFKDRTLFFDSSAMDPGYLRVHGDIGHLKEVAITTNAFGESIDMLDYWTLEAWVRTTDGNGGSIVSKWAQGPESDDYNYYLGLNPDGTLLGKFTILQTYISDASNNTQTTVVDTDVNDIEGTIPVNDGKWHHVAFVRDANYTYLYVDGYLDIKQPGLIFNFTYTPLVDLTLRKYEGPYVIGYGLDGDIDEVRLWGRGLTGAELDDVSSQNLIGTEEDLVSYFNFDFQQGETADERSALRDNSQEAGIYVPTAERILGGDLPITVYPLRTYVGAALSGYFAADDGGLTLEDYTHPLDWEYAGFFSNDVDFAALNAATAVAPPFLPDSDADGMPDWWENQFGLNIGEGAGAMGAYGDPDHDGLVNTYEWQAYNDYGVLLDPLKFDTAQDGGVGDYDTKPASTNLTYGERYDDGDQLPDVWEYDYPTAMNPLVFDTTADPDFDGWDNWSEYVYEGPQSNLVGNIRSSDPSSAATFPLPKITGTLRYEGNSVKPYHVYAYDNPDMAGASIAVGIITNVGSTVAYIIQGDFSGGVYLFAYRGDSPDAVPPIENVEPDGSAFHYMTGDPYGTPYTNPVAVSFGEVKNVDIYISDESRRPWYPSFSWTNQLNTLEAYVRIKNSAGQLILTRSVNPAHDYENPADPLSRIGYFNEVDYQRGTYTGTNYALGLAPGNYTWTVASNGSAGVSAYFALGNFSVQPYTPSAPTVNYPINGAIVRNAKNNFRWTTDQLAAQFELSISPTDGSWTWTKNLATPWRNSSGVYEYRVPTLFGVGQFTNGNYRWRLRAKNGDASYTSGYSSYGTFSISVTNPPPTGGGSPGLEGSYVYNGYKPASTKIYVQAYKSPNYSGEVWGQDVRTNVTASYAIKGLYSEPYYVRAFADFDGDGLVDDWEPQGIARDGVFGGDNYEYWTEYGIGMFDLTTVPSLTSIRIAIRDRDTDGDNMPDSWEYTYFGSITPTDTQDNDSDGLSNGGEYAARSNPGAVDTDGDGMRDGWEVANGLNVTASDASLDSDSDGLTNLQEYQQNLNPQSNDTDGDGIQDGTEGALGGGFSASTANNDPLGVPGGVKVAWDGNAANYNPYHAVSNPTGTDLSVTRADTDGDGISDLEEIAAGSGPLNPTNAHNVVIGSISSNGNGQPTISWSTYSNQASVDVIFTLQYSVDMVNWFTVGVLETTGDANATSTLIDTATHDGTIYYRLTFEIPVEQ